MMVPDNISNTGLLLSFALVLLVGVIYRYKKLGLERDIIFSSLRAFVQLLALGYVIHLIFRIDQLVYFVGIFLAMSLVAAITPAKRGKGIPYIYSISLAGIVLSTAVALLPLTMTGILSMDPKIIIPIGGMIIASTMNAVSILVDRLKSEYLIVSDQLNSTSDSGERRAILHNPLRAALKAAAIPAFDMTKVTGLVSIPGVMAGMIMGGIDPYIAVRYQIVILYMILCAYSIATVFVMTVLGRVLSKEITFNFSLCKGGESSGVPSGEDEVREES